MRRSMALSLCETKCDTQVYGTVSLFCQSMIQVYGSVLLSKCDTQVYGTVSVKQNMIQVYGTVLLLNKM